MQKNILILLISVLMFGCDNKTTVHTTLITLTCLELTGVQKAEFDNDGTIPKGSIVSTKTPDDCNKAGGIVMRSVNTQ